MKIIGLLLCKRFVQNYSNLGIHSKIYVPQESLYETKINVLQFIMYHKSI